MTADDPDRIPPEELGLRAADHATTVISTTEEPGQQLRASCEAQPSTAAHSILPSVEHHGDDQDDGADGVDGLELADNSCDGEAATEVPAAAFAVTAGDEEQQAQASDGAAGLGDTRGAVLEEKEPELLSGALAADEKVEGAEENAEHGEETPAHKLPSASAGTTLLEEEDGREERGGNEGPKDEKYEGDEKREEEKEEEHDERGLSDAVRLRTSERVTAEADVVEEAKEDTNDVVTEEEAEPEEDAADTHFQERSMLSSRDEDSQAGAGGEGEEDNQDNSGIHRRTSVRTEALIHAAARAVVATLEQQESTGRASHSGSDHGLAGHRSGESDDDLDDLDGLDDADELDDHDEIDDDDVFSDRGLHSGRTSLGSSAGSSHGGSDKHGKKQDSYRATGHDDSTEKQLCHGRGSPRLSTATRLSDVTGISRLSQYEHCLDDDDDDDVDHDVDHDLDHENNNRDNAEKDAAYFESNHGLSTLRGTPRPVFRTPSAVRALQMSSPSPSVIFGTGSPRRRRQQQHTQHQHQSDSGVGGENCFSPPSMTRKTPQSGGSRLKVLRPDPAPLVLLHATLMPSRWVWGPVLDGLDHVSAAAAKAAKGASAAKVAAAATEAARPRQASGNQGSIPGNTLASHGSQPGSPARTRLAEAEEADGMAKGSLGGGLTLSAGVQRLQAAWWLLKDYSGGDTVAERGVLLPHPQNDYEVLEERLLEALELPVRRRARILECGHYLGPANEEDDDDDDDDDDAFGDDDDNTEDDEEQHKPISYTSGQQRQQQQEQKQSRRHWCTTCRSEIQYESLGAERVFRVKVYASNGLMTTGAWAACWREMERVDVEIEPVVTDTALLRELARLRKVLEDMEMAVDEEYAMGRKGQVDEDEDEDDEDEDGDEGDGSRGLEGDDVRGMGQFAAHASNVAASESPRERPAMPTVDQHNDGGDDAANAEHRRREAEARLREIYGRTPPAALRTVAGAVDTAGQANAADLAGSAHLASPAATVIDGDTAHVHFVDDDVGNDTSEGLDGGVPWPPSPSAEALERRQERRRQFSMSSSSGNGFGGAGRRGFEYAGDRYHEYYHGHSNSHSRSNSHNSHTAYQSASLPELLWAAVQVVLRDHKQVAITVVSALVIVLVALRSPSQPQVPVRAAVAAAEVGSIGISTGQQQQHGQLSDIVQTASVAVAGTTADTTTNARDSLSSAELDEVVRPARAAVEKKVEIVSINAKAAFDEDTIDVDVDVETQVQVATVTEKKTVKVRQTVTETAVEYETETVQVRASATAAAAAEDEVVKRADAVSEVAQPKVSVEAVGAAEV